MKNMLVFKSRFFIKKKDKESKTFRRKEKLEMCLQCHSKVRFSIFHRLDSSR